jgi:hypothetical protein
MRINVVTTENCASLGIISSKQLVELLALIGRDNMVEIIDDEFINQVEKIPIVDNISYSSIIKSGKMEEAEIRKYMQICERVNQGFEFHIAQKFVFNPEQL